MRRVVLAMVAVVGMRWGAESHPAEEKAVREALRQFNEAAKAGDGAALDRLLDAELIYGHSNALVEDKAACIAALVASKPEFVVADGATVRIYGKTAVVHGRMVARVVEQGKANQIPLDFVQVWVKRGNNWRMVTRHTVRVSQP
jgi:ketosteroid isomerase-like protein